MTLLLAITIGLLIGSVIFIGMNESGIMRDFANFTIFSMICIAIGSSLCPAVFWTVVFGVLRTKEGK